MFYARQGSFCNRARLNFQAFALRDMKMVAQESCRIGQKIFENLMWFWTVPTEFF